MTKKSEKKTKNKNKNSKNIKSQDVGAKLDNLKKGKESKGKKIKNLKDRIDEINLGVNESEQLWVFKDQVESTASKFYGSTMDAVFEKERREKVFGIYSKPWLSRTKRFFLCLTNFTLSLGTTIIAILWMFMIRKIVPSEEESLGDENVVPNRTTFAPHLYSGIQDSDELTKDQIEKRIQEIQNPFYAHILGHVVIFCLILPQLVNSQILFLGIDNTYLLISKIILKFFVGLLYILGWIDIKVKLSQSKSDVRAHNVDGKIHLLSSYCTHITMMTWIVCSALLFLGKLIPTLFKLRFGIGRLFIEASSGFIHDVIDGLNQFMGLICLTSGLYLFSFHVIKHGFVHENNSERMIVELLGTLFIVLFTVVLFQLAKKHDIESHTSSITYKIFKNYFLEFKDLKTKMNKTEEELIEIYDEGLPRVTLPVRRA